jgi:hypothetical protein
MLKGVALKHLWLEEGQFWPGLEIAPGYMHDPYSRKPTGRILDMHPPHRAHILQTRGDILLFPEEPDTSEETLLEINKQRMEQFADVFPILKFHAGSE